MDDRSKNLYDNTANIRLAYRELATLFITKAYHFDIGATEFSSLGIRSFEPNVFTGGRDACVCCVSTKSLLLMKAFKISDE